MLKQRARLVSLWVFIADLTFTVIAFFPAYWLRADALGSLIGPLSPLSPVQDYMWLLLVILPLWSILLFQFRLYESQRTKPIWQEIFNLLKVSIIGTLVLTSIVFAVKAHYVSRPVVFFFGLVSFVFISTERVLLRLCARSLRTHGYNYRNIVIVGTGRRARELARTINDHRQWGLRLLGFVSDNPNGQLEKIGDVPILGKVIHIPKILHNEVVDELIFAVSRKRLEELEEIFLHCEEEGVRTRVAVNFFPHMIAKVQLEDLHGIPLLTFTTTPHSEALMAVKRVLDVSLASLALILTTPIFLVAGIGVRLSSPGPVFFRQTRVGLNGRRFTLYKFRSMYIDAESKKENFTLLNEMDGPAFKMADDPRATPIGRWLRRTSLDELPQLLNVLRGDMSIVGPRPPLPEEVEKYESWHRRKLSMKPGITCLWQISGRNRIQDFNRWMELDLAYIDNWSLKLDLKIFFKTVAVVLLGKGAY